MPFPDLPARLAEVRVRIADAVSRGGHGQRVTLVAVTKTHGPDAPRAAKDCGIEDVGENKVQEALPKMDAAGVSLRWHLIGHLQRNKAKSADRFALVHSIDSPRLGAAVAAVGEAKGKAVDVLLQVNVAGEVTKGGVERTAVGELADALVPLKGIAVLGVMTMAPLDADERVLRDTFSGARSALAIVRAAGHSRAIELSMGMSGDYEIAVEEGATIVRLGTVLFGARTT
jgi:pyridoxal phosphate enzyme (YggS family)